MQIFANMIFINNFPVTRHWELGTRRWALGTGHSALSTCLIPSCPFSQQPFGSQKCYD